MPSFPRDHDHHCHSAFRVDNVMHADIGPAVQIRRRANVLGQTRAQSGSEPWPAWVSQQTRRLRSVDLPIVQSHPFAIFGGQTDARNVSCPVDGDKILRTLKV